MQTIRQPVGGGAQQPEQVRAVDGRKAPGRPLCGRGPPTADLEEDHEGYLATDRGFPSLTSMAPKNSLIASFGVSSHTASRKAEPPPVWPHGWRCSAGGRTEQQRGSLPYPTHKPAGIPDVQGPFRPRTDHMCAGGSSA